MGKFKLIKEFTEFNNMRLNNDSVPMSTHVDNPGLSLDGYSKFDANMRMSLSRLNDIYKNINKTNTSFNLKSGDFVTAEDIKNIKILRIYPKDDIFLNVYFTFDIDDKEYYGKIEKLNANNPKLTSEIFKDINIQGGKEWKIRIKGNLIKAIKKWLNPSVGEYIALKDIDVFNELTGGLYLIPISSKIKVKRTIDDDQVLISFNNIDYIIKGRNFYYFNYYFSPLEDE